MENRMIVDKNTKKVMLGNVEIKRIMSGGGTVGKATLLEKVWIKIQL